MTLDGHICLSDQPVAKYAFHRLLGLLLHKKVALESLQFRTLQAKHDGVSFPYVGLCFWLAKIWRLGDNGSGPSVWTVIQGIQGDSYIHERLVGRSTSRESIDVYRTSSKTLSSLDLNPI